MKMRDVKPGYYWFRRREADTFYSDRKSSDGKWHPARIDEDMVVWTIFKEEDLNGGFRVDGFSDTFWEFRPMPNPDEQGESSGEAEDDGLKCPAYWLGDSPYHAHLCRFGVDEPHEQHECRCGIIQK